MNRVIVYFDGFNFYNGLKEKSELDPHWKNYYWIDFVKFSKQFFGPESSIECVKYFTAPPINKFKRSRQSALLNANKLINQSRFQIFNGHYSQKQLTCLAECGQRYTTSEEKCTDVSFSLEIICDFLDDKLDTAVLVTADSDQIPTIKAIKNRFPLKKIKLHFPPERNSTELRGLVNPVIFHNNFEKHFSNAQMSTIVTDGNKKYTKPKEWTI